MAIEADKARVEAEKKRLAEAEAGRDNVETITLCEAVFATGQEHRVTTVREFLV